MAEKLREVDLALETALSMREGCKGYTGQAMAVKIAGEDVIVIARNISKLNTVFNYIIANLHGGSLTMCERETLQSKRCHDVVVVPRKDVTLDDQL